MIQSAFVQRYPTCHKLIANLERIEEAVSSIKFEAFFEPVSVVETAGQDAPPRLATLTADHVNAWVCHVGYGTLARLRNSMEPYLLHLLEGRPLLAGMIQRSILENAGRAAHSLESLRDSCKMDCWDELRTIIPRSLFGTCITRPEGTVFESLAELTAQRAIPVSKLIDSLERFAGTEEPTGVAFFKGVYALLCDLTHASQRANQSFCRLLADTGEGWQLEYSSTESDYEPGAVEGALKSTMRCLQAGYGSSAMLLRWRLVDTPNGLSWKTPAEQDAD